MRSGSLRGQKNESPALGFDATEFWGCRHLMSAPVASSRPVFAARLGRTIGIWRSQSIHGHRPTRHAYLASWERQVKLAAESMIH